MNPHRHLYLAPLFILSSACLAGTQSLHESIDCLGGHPSETAYFEQSDNLGKIVSSCRFLKLTGDSEPGEAQNWQREFEVAQGLTLTGRPAVNYLKGVRQEWVDGQNRTRSVTWYQGGRLTEIAWFDENKHILKLDRWRNQVEIPDAELEAIPCGPSTEHPMGIRAFRGGHTGKTNREMAELESLADTVTNYALVNYLGLPVTASADIAQAKSRLIAAASTEGRNPKGSPNWLFNRPLVVAPNPANAMAVIFYQLAQPCVNVRIAIHNLTGSVQQVFPRGSQDAGIYQLSYEIQGLADGLYFATLVTNDGSGDRAISEFKFSVRH